LRNSLKNPSRSLTSVFLFEKEPEGFAIQLNMEIGYENVTIYRVTIHIYPNLPKQISIHTQAVPYFTENYRNSIDEHPLSWYNVLTFPREGAFLCLNK